MAKLNILVAGSTGYIGIQLVKLLSKHKPKPMSKKQKNTNFTTGKDHTNHDFFDNENDN